MLTKDIRCSNIFLADAEKQKQRKRFKKYLKKSVDKRQTEWYTNQAVTERGHENRKWSLKTEQLMKKLNPSQKSVWSKDQSEPLSRSWKKIYDQSNKGNKKSQS